jgi:phage shock protein PspC (stress-responsive transcriptional regulator)
MPTPSPWDEIDAQLKELESLQGRSHPYPTALFPAFFKSAHIQVGIAKMNDIATKRLVRLTWALLIFTVALFFLTVYLAYDVYTDKHHDNLTHQSSTQK